MAEYDAIEDMPVGVNSPGVASDNPVHEYTIGGVPATDATRGIVIRNSCKTVRK